MQTKTDQSYGVLPIRWMEGEWQIFLIHQFSKIGNNSYWIFPKGHPEPNETPAETAKRELLEETGMSVSKLLNEPVFTLQYNFVFDGVRIDKRVDFFLGIITDFEFKLQVEEVKEAGWYSLEEAGERLDYQDTKTMFVEVKAFLRDFADQ
ncbi:NUDIX domain-containing protein [Candidatus Kaiserbacteria bacterium]|nr:NUDIX domain-containing protein [Candidatus Kaiserbacteria bacterium]